MVEQEGVVQEEHAARLFAEDPGDGGGHPGQQGPAQMPGRAEQLGDAWDSLALCQE